MNDFRTQYVRVTNMPGYGVYRYARSRPSWISRVAGTIFVLAIALPFLFLFFLAAAAALVVFGTLSLGHALARALTPGSGGGTRPAADRRENVRVIGTRDD